LLFHSFDFKKNSTLLEYFHSKIGAKNSTKIRFAIAFYIQNFINSPIYFEISQFSNYKNYKAKYIKNPNEIKSEILNLDWNKKSHKLVITLTNEIGIVDSLLNFLFPVNTNLANLSPYADDEISKQLKYQNIHFKKVDFKKNQVDQSIIDQICGEHLLCLYTTDICQEDYLKELYFLKRNLFSSISDYKSSRKDKVFPSKYDKLNDLRFYSKLYLDCETFKKVNEFPYVEQAKISRIVLKFNGDILEPTRNLFLTWANCLGANNIWIEIFEDERSLKRILDIHLTAECLVEDFNKIRIRSLSVKINIAKIHRLLFDSKLFTFICVDEDLSKAEIKNPSESVFEAMECFSHFTYEKTNQNLIVIDLRTLRLSKNEFLITEPVVFSMLPERFSSSDLGLSGIENFKNQHKCNRHCKEIDLRPFRN